MPLGYSQIYGNDRVTNTIKYEIGDFPGISYQDPPEGTDVKICSICHDAIEKGGKNIKTPCNHYYHKDCINRWFETGKDTCPLRCGKFEQKDLSTRVREWFMKYFGCCFRCCSDYAAF